VAVSVCRVLDPARFKRATKQVVAGSVYGCIVSGSSLVDGTGVHVAVLWSGAGLLQGFTCMPELWWAAVLHSAGGQISEQGGFTVAAVEALYEA